MFWYDHNMGWWGYAGMGIGMVLFWALVALVPLQHRRSAGPVDHTAAVAGASSG